MGAGCSRDDTEKLDKFTGATPVVKPAAQTDNRQTAVVDKHTDSYAENKGKKYTYYLYPSKEVLHQLIFFSF